MVLILLSIILAAIAIAISMTRCHRSIGSLAGSGIVKGSSSIVKEGAEPSWSAGQTRQFLVVVLPDGKVVNPMAADRF
jgi:hypothetical protein